MYVARFLVCFLARSMTLRQVQAQIDNMNVTDPTSGTKMPVCRNPETSAPWSLTTIGKDALAIKEAGKRARNPRPRTGAPRWTRPWENALPRLRCAAGDLKALAVEGLACGRGE